MKFSIVSIEDCIAVLEGENKLLYNVNIDELPDNIKNGQILILSDGKYYIDYSDTALRRKEVYEKFSKLINKN